MKTVAPIISFFLLVVTGFCFNKIIDTTPPQKKIVIVFHHRVGNTLLSLGDSVTNILGDKMVIERFRYYVSNFSITNDQDKIIKLPVQYFLVDEEDSSSKRITLTIPDISIRSIHFLLGVDSIRNVSGIQTGTLDPLKGMFWTWNSGYIMAKLEGICETVASAGRRFTYDIGGFRNGMNVAKKIDLKLPMIDPLHEINISADIDHWFKGSSELKITETPVCHSPGSLAMRIADNYSTMFSINSIR